MATKLSIWNRALHKVGELRISGLTEDSVNKRLLESIYEDDKRAVLEMHSWKFARALANLGLNTASPAFGYANSFQLPTNFIKILDFNNTDPEYRERHAFTIVGQELHTDEDSAKITYLKDVDTPGLFSPGFVEALSMYLARNIAYTRTKSQPLFERLDAAFETALAKAKRADASGDITPRSALSSYPNIAARLGQTSRNHNHLV